jgi:hypothetical protein
VLLPRTVLPLHVFEKRYRIMTREALAGPRFVAISLLKTGYEATYHTLDAPIHPVVCVGRILREECLADGRYNFLLQGVTRARIVREDKGRPYRRAALEPLVAPPANTLQENALRCELQRLLMSEPLAAMATQGHWFEILDCPDLTFSDLVDIIGSALLSCPEDKQHFLEEPCVMVRSKWLFGLLDMLIDPCDDAPQRPYKTRTWPPTSFAN